ncbi:LacI family DNA-binding transcriptional regulator [Neiella sp. HB171785]|uniref:LacI family DNA-binding transcriptional regulator n=1 Tax=Neiella litorisoli TaxID=2771431 RepID=A0A8J6QTU1_9GAMM|nr:LacI family DNA-binding transcriptional regulator [Neiella litorisoli]MBD1389152.1 LacI family DNA-binding transcriptional regulator [Neiella litorisoli]
MSNIRDVAKVAGVSIATVSRALSAPETVSKKSLKKVHDAIEQVQYKPNMLARNFRRHRAFTIVVLVPNMANTFFATVVRGIEDVMQQHGFGVLLGDTRDQRKREEEYLKLVETRQADGVIQLRPYWEGDSILPKDDIIAVNAAGCEDTPYPCVRIDNAGAAKTATDYLLSLGHKRIGVITGLSENPHTIDRLKGYRQSLTDAGIECCDEWVAEGEFTMWSGLNAAQHFIRLAPEERPTAILSMNDEMAIGAIKGFRAAGIKVPEDMSIIGFDDIEVSRYAEPALTTIAQPAEEIGKAAANMLLRLIEGKELRQSDYILPYEFVVRSSSVPFTG